MVEYLIYAHACNLLLINIANPEETSVREYAFALDNALHEAQTLNFDGVVDILTTCNFVPEIREKDRLEQSLSQLLPKITNRKYLLTCILCNTNEGDSNPMKLQEFINIKNPQPLQRSRV